MKRDISKFNPRVIPITEAKKDLIEASRSPIDVWICDNYNDLIKGILCDDALMIRPPDMKERTFQLQLKDKCDYKKIQKNGVRKGYYILKQECRGIYSQTEDDPIDDDAI